MSNYLPQAIDSALAQEYQHLNIIIVDDGSTDDIVPVIKKYSERVTYIRQENAGLPAARNTGIKHSNAEFICFLDADDIILPSKIGSQVSCFMQNPSSDIVHGYSLLFDNDNIFFPYAEMRPAVPWNDYLDPLSIFCPFAVHSALLRRNMFDRVGLFRETLKSGCEDWAFWLECALRGAVFTYMPELSALYRKHRTSMSTQLRRLVLNESIWLPLIPRRMVEAGFFNEKRASLIACGHRLIASRFLKLGMKKESAEFFHASRKLSAHKRHFYSDAGNNPPISYLLLAADLCDLGLPQLACFCLLDFGDMSIISQEAVRSGLTELFNAVIECIKKPYIDEMNTVAENPLLNSIYGTNPGPAVFRELENYIPKHISHVSYLIHQLGRLDQEAGKIDAAVARYRHALAMNPFVWQWYEELAYVLVAIGSKSEAESLISAVLHLNPEFRYGQYHMGKSLMREGRIAQGGRYFLKLISDDPRLIVQSIVRDVRRMLGMRKYNFKKYYD